MDNALSIISGGGGGGGGGEPHTPIEMDDTLSSKQRVRMLFVVGEGEIESVDDVDVNGSPISGFDATFEYRTGTVDQTHILGFTAIESPASPAVNTQLVFGSPVIREVSTNAIDAVLVTLKIISLYLINHQGDTLGYQVNFKISTRKDDNDIWSDYKFISKKGKATSPYKFDVRVERPADAVGSTWQIQVERNWPDDPDSKKASVTFFDNYTEIQDSILTYPHSALVGIVFNNADELGGKIPTLSFEGKWKKISVPDATVYDPVERTYVGGAWSGAFALAKISTSCLAWHLYDVLIDTRAGLGISAAEINAFSFYDFAVECDELIDDGSVTSTLEHRYSINNQFYRRENASTFLTFLLTLGNAKLANDEFGLISVISDRPEAASRIVNNSNVINGVFDYSSGELDETFSWVNVTFNDPNDKHNARTISEKRQDRIDSFGLIKSDVVLIGCTSEGQARRKAKWVLNSPNDAVTFKVGLEGLVYRLGQVIEIMDDIYKNVLQQGRIVSASSDASFTTIVLDREITFGNQNYSVLCYGADAVTVYDAVIVEQNVTTNTIIVNVPGPLATDPNPNSSFIIRGDIEPSLYRVMTIEEDEGIFTILATQYDPNKQSLIESGITNSAPTKPFINTGGFVVEPVENIQFAEIFASSDIEKISRIGVTWDWDTDESEDLIATYQYTWRRDNLPFSAIQTTPQKEFEIPDVTPGVYEVVITAYNPRGIRSTPVIQTYNFRTVSAQSTLKPPINLYVVNTVSNVFQTRDLSISWFYDVTNDDRTLVNDALLDYVVEIWSAGLLKNTYVVTPTSDKNGTFTYTFQDNENDHGAASRSVEVRVYSRDTVGDASLAITNTFTNPVPAVVSFTLLAGTGSTYIDITPPSDPDIAGYLVYRDTSIIDFTPGAGNLKYDGPDNYVALGGNAGVQYFYKVAAFDSFGKTALNVSGGSGSKTQAAETDKFAFTGIPFAFNDPVVDSVSWGAGTVSINGAVPAAIAAGNSAWTTGTLYIYFDKATVSIGSTTDITVAVQKAQILAAYEGAENLKGGDGTGFFNGAELLAQSIGANKLVVDSAIITTAAQIAALIVKEAHIDNLAITSGKVANTLESNDFDPILKTGWQISKDGGTMTLNDLTFKSVSGTSGERMEIDNEVLQVFDYLDNLRVKLGKLI